MEQYSVFDMLKEKYLSQDERRTLSSVASVDTAFKMCMCVCMCAQSHPTLCDPMDCSPQGSSVHVISQSRILDWVAMPFSRDLPDPGIELTSPALQADYLPAKPWGKTLLDI